MMKIQHKDDSQDENHRKDDPKMTIHRKDDLYDENSSQG